MPALKVLALLALHLLLAACARPVRMLADPGATVGCRAPASSTEEARLAWIRPADDDERRALDARCAQVGPPLITTARGRGGRAVTHLAVATWNLHDGRGDVLRLLRDLQDGRHGTPIPDAVVLLLQEAVRPVAVRSRDASSRRPGADPSPPGARDLPALAGSLGWHLAYAPARPIARTADRAVTADRGTAILSSLPLEDVTAIELPIERQRRLALAATVRGVTASGRTWRLRVVSAHLENRPGARRLWVRAAAARRRQAEALLDALRLDGHRDADPRDDTASAMVLGGDLNTWLGGREPALRLLREAFPTWSTEDTRPTLAFRRRLDHLFARLPAGATHVHRRLDDRYGSDHHPVVAAIDFQPD